MIYLTRRLMDPQEPAAPPMATAAK
jgi:hypothetical protein